jgi:polyphosphate kinase 2
MKKSKQDSGKQDSSEQETGKRDSGRRHLEETAETPVGAGEMRRDAAEQIAAEGRWRIIGDGRPPKRSPEHYKYIDELVRLQFELLKMQEWVRLRGLRVCVLFEGRDAAGKGGVIKRITEALNPRVCRVAALATPTERERGQWYFQRYAQHLPTTGEIVLFDRSWYNRAGVERVMGFCTEQEYWEFLRSCPLFEDMLVRSGMYLVKYWFSVNDEEQERRFAERMQNPIKRWKLSRMDLEARKHWVEYSRAKDIMLEYTDHKKARWHIVDADNKKRARLNCIAHLLGQVPYKDLLPVKLDLPARQPDDGYKRPKKSSQLWVPQIY